MVKLSKKLEYALIALRHISSNKEDLCSARDISIKYGIPHGLLSKILQSLKKQKILTSNKGVNGGYRLLKSLNKITLTQLYEVIGKETSLVECLSIDKGDCNIKDSCTIKTPINKIQDEFNYLLSTKYVSDFL